MNAKEARSHPIENGGVHRTHCCDKHGCKYGNDNCPVVLKKIRQTYPCNTCGEKDQGRGGFYEQKGHRLIWHPYVSDIIVRAAKQLGARGKGKLSSKVIADLLFAASVFNRSEQEYEP
jgi:hypothetical protein